jgi:hypothetical protein
VAVELWIAKVPFKKIMEQLQLSKATLVRLLAHAREHPDRPAKPRKTSTGFKSLKVMESTLRDMRKRLLRNPTLTAKQLKAMLSALENIFIRTIQKICLAKLKLPSRKMAPKPLLNQEAMKDKRLAFCKHYRNLMVDDWKNVMFSDERNLEPTFGNRTRLRRRPPGSYRLDPRFTRKTIKHPPKLVAWGCFSWKVRGALEWLEKGEIMNGLRYR